MGGSFYYILFPHPGCLSGPYHIYVNLNLLNQGSSSQGKSLHNFKLHQFTDVKELWCFNIHISRGFISFLDCVYLQRSTSKGLKKIGYFGFLCRSIERFNETTTKPSMIIYNLIYSLGSVHCPAYKLFKNK